MVSGKFIGDAAAEVESHCARCDEDPVEVFETPREFAKELAHGGKKSIAWPLHVARAILALGRALLLLKGILGWSRTTISSEGFRPMQQ